MRVSICSNGFPEQIKKSACHEVFASSDYILTVADDVDAVFDSDGIRVAVIVAGEKHCHTIEKICAAKAQHDVVIVSYPCGVMTGMYPSARIRQACRTMVKSGADVVWCHIDGGIGSFELYRGANILYGCGEQENGMIVHLDISDNIELQFIPARITETEIELLEGKERQKRLEQLVINSERLKNKA